MNVPFAPLRWPANAPRSPKTKTWPSPLKSDVVDGLLNELRLMGIPYGDYTLTSGLMIGQRGTPLAKPLPEDPAVVLYFTKRNREFCIPVDCFDSPWGNIRAITLLLEGRRREERYMPQSVIDASWQALALPARKTWWQVLGLLPGASRAEVDAQYRDLARRFHPDNGGDARQMAEINAAYAEFKMEALGS